MTAPRWAAACACALLLSGCGDEALWARWRAESALWHARTAEHKVLDREYASPAALDRVERKLRAVMDAFPSSEWVPRAAAGGPARDVAVVSARAALELAGVLTHRGRDAEAAGLLANVIRDDAPLTGAVAEARRARMDALERSRRFDEAIDEGVALAAMDPLGEPGAPALRPVLLAPIEVALRLRGGGRDAEADAVLARADDTFLRDLPRTTGDDLSSLADALSRVRAARHDAHGALQVLRAAMRADDPRHRPYYVRAMAARAFDAGAPESVFAYSRWAAQLSGSRDIAGSAWYVEGQAWEALGQPDSALADWDALLRQWTDPGSLGPTVRFREGVLLERMGQWERAQAAYLALQARYPSDPLSFDAMRRIVHHHMQAGEPEMARIVGHQTIQGLDRALVTNLDPAVQRLGREVRADLLLTLGQLDDAEQGLLDLWLRFPEDSLAEDAGLRAAGLAAHRPGGALRADSILSVLRHTAANATVRRAAAERAGPEGTSQGGRR